LVWYWAERMLRLDVTFEAPPLDYFYTPVQTAAA
jgi:hypothetical protein